MKVSCPNCSFTGDINDDLIPEAGRNVGCPKCKTNFFVNKDASIVSDHLHTESKEQQSYKMEENPNYTRYKTVSYKPEPNTFVIEPFQVKKALHTHRDTSEDTDAKSWMFTCLFVVGILSLLIFIPLAIFIAPVFFLVLAVLWIIGIVIGISAKRVSKQ